MGKRRHFESEYHRSLTVVEAAYLASLGESQQRIADRLGWAQRTIANLLSEAQDAKILGNRRFNLSAVQDPGVVAEFSAQYNWQRQDYLHQRINRWRPEGNPEIQATVCSAISDMHGTAAACLGQLLSKAKLIGLMYGHTVRELITAVKHSRTLEDHVEGAQCIPLCGDPVYLLQRESIPLTASSLAADFDRNVLGNIRGLHPTLTGVPAYVRSSYARQMIASKTWRFFVESPGYKEIFGSIQNGRHTGAVAKLDAIVTGVGIVCKETCEPGLQTGSFIRERLIQERKTERSIRQHIVGDVGGLLITADSTLESRKKADLLNAGWTGVVAGDLLQIAQRANTERPGVIVAAFHAAKAEAIRAIIRLGYVNRLIISDALASRLIDMPN